MLRGWELLVATRYHIATHPEESDQETWASRYSCCSSAYCAAGTAVVLAGDTILWQEFPLPTIGCVDAAGKEYLISDRAAELLGLSNEERSLLFFCRTSAVLDVLDQLIERRQGVCGGNDE